LADRKVQGRGMPVPRIRSNKGAGLHEFLDDRHYRDCGRNGHIRNQPSQYSPEAQIGPAAFWSSP
jgi:hypothetical protein